MLRYLTACSLLVLPLAAAAQTTGTTATTATTTSTTTTSTAAVNTTHAEDKLVDEYSKLAGSKENARKLVVALRTGGDARIGGETIKTPTDRMGVGNVKIALALTEAKLDQQGIEKPTAKQLNAALAEILKMRADGMGWGKIAHSMDMKLGEVMRHDRPEKHHHHAKHERVEKHERVAKIDRPEKPERPEKPVRFEKPERPERHGK